MSWSLHSTGAWPTVFLARCDRIFTRRGLRVGTPLISRCLALTAWHRELAQGHVRGAPPVSNRIASLVSPKATTSFRNDAGDLITHVPPDGIPVTFLSNIVRRGGMLNIISDGDFRARWDSSQVQVVEVSGAKRRYTPCVGMARFPSFFLFPAGGNC